jgi:hypothetical protein
MAQAAVHDALNTIDRRYDTYALDLPENTTASPEAAVGAAAHDLLIHELPVSQHAFLNAAKSIGDVNSTTRTPEQSDIAKFWYEASAQGWNRIARTVSAQEGLDLWENARLFALVNFALADGSIGNFDTKYLYNNWRPITVIPDRRFRWK